VIARTNRMLDPADFPGIVTHSHMQAWTMNRSESRKSLARRIAAGAALALSSAAAEAQEAVTITGDQPLPYSEHCLGSDALQAAKALYLHDYGFAVGDPAKSAGLLDPRLSDRLATNFACEKDGICALESDAWTGAQDGAVAEPITITYADDAAARSITDVKVRFSFMFVLEGQKPEPMSAILEFARDGEGQCWKLFDMTSADGASLMQQLIDYQDKP
jgi:hypothetical protein